MKENHIYKARTPKKQKNWQPWEEVLIAKADGGFTSKQLSNIFECLGSTRTPCSIERKAGVLGWKVKGARC